MVEPKESYSLEDSLGYWINRVAAAMQVSFERELAPLGVTARQWAVLMACYHGQARTPIELARALGVDGSAVTRLLDRLEEKKLIQRRARLSDRRSLEIQLTDAGRELVPKLIPISNKVNERYLMALPESERSGRFLDLLQGLLTQADR